MIETPKIELFLARITKVKDRETYEILVEVPGYGQDIPAVPLSRGEMDEPVEGNLVIIMSLDPYHHNVNFYTKLKENKFVGIRSNGKVLDMTKDYVTLGAEDNSKTHKDTYQQEEHIMAPDKAYIRFDNDGNITIEAEKDLNITIKGGNTTLKSSTSVTIDSPDVTITGGNFTAKGSASVNSSTGSFCAIPNCLLTGLGHRYKTTEGN